MEEAINRIYNCLSSFLPETIDNNRINLIIRMQIRKCLNYMNREDFPSELIEPLAEAIVLEQLNNKEQEVKRVTAGDTSIEYNTGQSSSDLILISMKEQLNRFRRVGTIGTIIQK